MTVVVQDGGQFAKYPFVWYWFDALQFSLPYQPFQSPSIPLLSASSPSHHSIEEDAGNHRLVKHPEELAADIEGPQPPQEVQPALPFLVECLSVGWQVRFIVQVYPQILLPVYHIHIDPLNGDWQQNGLRDLPKSTTISLVLAVLSCRWLSLHNCTKSSKRLLYSPSCPFTNVPHNRSIVRNLLHVAWLCVVAEDRRVQGEQDRSEHSSLRCSCATEWIYKEGPGSGSPVLCQTNLALFLLSEKELHLFLIVILFRILIIFFTLF